jgi:hypothetical protein
LNYYLKGGKKMGKIYTKIIVGFLVLTTIMGSSISAVTEIKQNNATPTEEQEFIPTVCSFTLRGRQGNDFDFEANHPVSNISNWTDGTQTVRIQWTIVNKDYDYSHKVLLLVRVREWRTDFPFPIFAFYLRGGKISTPDYPSLFPRIEFPKFIKIFIQIEANENTNGSKDINVTIDPWLTGEEIQLYCVGLCPEKVGVAKGGAIVTVP